ncbi:two-component system, OmpR family, response regulator MtrA [Pseudonocardia thermophila]|uniref:Two-component system, OmpR family, response regulator MtrA n=1 Tax=Pseudonocardia thermophila TaxID=1848 RepID=A0A1M6ZV87_PSETH|nr:response regulator transcription factor [Pseudonocardia thermophila]SHL34334.1 two-component system, OmpR family, response regulator MtrA [Pseudonocardia thermophila]
MTVTALVVEDEPQMADIVEYILQTDGLDVRLARDGAQGWEQWSAGGIGLVVLDIELPGPNGLELCTRIRAASSVPILVLTARTDTQSVIAGLEAGADDYVTKPFHPRVLSLRVQALLRRAQPTRMAPTVVGDLEIDLRSGTVTVAGRQVSLAATEIRVLAALAERVGEVVSWRQLLATAWDVDDWVGGREMVKAAVYRLRHRLGDDPAHPRYIETVRGVGYRLVR